MKRKIIELEEIDSIEDFETANTFLLLDKNLNEIVTNTTKPLSKVASTSTLLQTDVEINLKSCLAETIASDTFWDDIIAMTKETYTTTTKEPYDSPITNSFIRNYIDNANTDRTTNSDTASDILDDISNRSSTTPVDDISNPNLIFELVNDEQKLTYDDVIERYQEEALVITESLSPFKILYVNDTWTDVCGFSSDEVIGKSLSFIQGPLTDITILKNMMEFVKSGSGVVGNLVNYQKNGKPFHNRLRISHIYDQQSSAIISCYGILKFEGFYQNHHDQV
jgi:PAS domain S-box-containing protein